MHSSEAEVHVMAHQTDKPHLSLRNCRHMDCNNGGIIQCKNYPNNSTSTYDALDYAWKMHNPGSNKQRRQGKSETHILAGKPAWSFQKHRTSATSIPQVF